MLERERARSAQKDFLISQLENALTEIKEEVGGVVERKEALEEAVKEKTERAREMEERAETLEKRVQELEGALQKLEPEQKPGVSLSLPAASRFPSVSSPDEDGALQARIAKKDAEVARLEQQVARLSQLLATVEQNRGQELQSLTEQLAASQNKIKDLESEASGNQTKRSLWQGRQIAQLREELLLSDREKDSLHRELALKEEAEAALQELEFDKSREAACAEREGLTSRAEEVERHLQELRIERDMLQQRIAVLQRELETLGRVNEENACLADEVHRLQRKREELEEQLRLQRLAHDQVIVELQELQKVHEQTMALCSELTLERSEAVERTEAHQRRNLELESELSLMADRQHQILQELATTQRAQKQAEDDYFLLLRKMEDLTEQIAHAHANKTAASPSPGPSSPLNTTAA
uniref:Uncharacterized protein n=1 Tax=Neospora caninum (strain Liverpool) TaxID=572307 RepID=F0JAW3_NEOCL|nr:hypothetical protein, conserved [Neospora caninum Liverpool]CEL71229.1 TPA: hypothetical protein, conserved [Neospora caninum Liverpool]